FDEMIASGNTGNLSASRRVKALERLGEAQLRAGRAGDAWRSADAAIAAQRLLASKSTPESRDHRMMAAVLILGSEASAAAGDSIRAESLLAEARMEAQESAKRPALTNLIPLARAEEALGRFYTRRGRIEEARACYERLGDLWEHFPDP